MKKVLKLILPLIATSLLFSGCSNGSFSEIQKSTIEDKQLDPQLSKAIEKTNSINKFTESGVINMKISPLNSSTSSESKTIKLDLDITSLDKGFNFYRKITENKKSVSGLYINGTSLLIKPSNTDKFVDISTTPKFTGFIGDVYTLNDQPLNLLSNKLLTYLNSKTLTFKDSTINLDERNINVKSLEETIPSKDLYDNLFNVAKSFLGFYYKSENELSAALKGIKLSDVKTNIYINKEDVIHAKDISFDITIDNKTNVEFKYSGHLTGYDNSKIALPKIDKEDIISFEQYNKK